MHTPNQIIRDHRVRLGLTQREIANLFGVTVTHVSSIENSRAVVPLTWVPILCELYGIDRTWFTRIVAAYVVDQAADKIASIKLTAAELAKIKVLQSRSPKKTVRR